MSGRVKRLSCFPFETDWYRYAQGRRVHGVYEWMHFYQPKSNRPRIGRIVIGGFR